MNLIREFSRRDSEIVCWNSLTAAFSCLIVFPNAQSHWLTNDRICGIFEISSLLLTECICSVDVVAQLITVVFLKVRSFRPTVALTLSRMTNLVNTNQNR